MDTTTKTALMVALVAGTLAGCDRTSETANKPQTSHPPQVSATASPPVPSGTPTVSIVDQIPDLAPPSAAERKDGAPIQGQVDPRQPEQRRAFETKKP